VGTLGRRCGMSVGGSCGATPGAFCTDHPLIGPVDKLAYASSVAAWNLLCRYQSSRKLHFGQTCECESSIKLCFRTLCISFVAVLSASTAFGDRLKPKSNCSDLLLPDLTGHAKARQGTTGKAGAVVRPINQTRSR
jgi:hypothetical protein